METTTTAALRDRLFEWHGGQWSGVYSVASTLNSNPQQTGTLDNVRRAIDELSHLKRDANYPECVTAEMEAEAVGLAEELAKRFAV